MRNVDVRLGTNKDLAELVKRLHDSGIRVLLDAVFNHVGRSFSHLKMFGKIVSPLKILQLVQFKLRRQQLVQRQFWYEDWEAAAIW